VLSMAERATYRKKSEDVGKVAEKGRPRVGNTKTGHHLAAIRAHLQVLQRRKFRAGPRARRGPSSPACRVSEIKTKKAGPMM